MQGTRRKAKKKDLISNTKEFIGLFGWLTNGTNKTNLTNKTIMGLFALLYALCSLRFLR